MILLMEEILHQLVGRLSHYLRGFIHPRWLFGISSMNSIVGCYHYVVLHPFLDLQGRLITLTPILQSLRGLTDWPAPAMTG